MATVFVAGFVFGAITGAALVLAFALFLRAV